MSRFALAALLVVFAAACGGSSEHSYPTEVVDNFMNSCTQKGSKESCTCAIDHIQKKFTLDEFRSMEARMANKGEIPKEMMDAIADCPAGAA
jgi:hypothetical protein